MTAESRTWKVKVEFLSSKSNFQRPNKATSKISNKATSELKILYIREIEIRELRVERVEDE